MLCSDTLNSSGDVCLSAAKAPCVWNLGIAVLLSPYQKELKQIVPKTKKPTRIIRVARRTMVADGEGVDPSVQSLDFIL